MKIKLTFIFLTLTTLCIACDSSLEEFFQTSPFEVNNGPLTNDEIQYFTSNMGDSLSENVAKCLSHEATILASKIGDPEMLDPNTVELLPVDQWSELNKFGKRLILTQVVINQAILPCTRGKLNSGPLTSDEIQVFVSNLEASLGEEVAECLSKEATVRASKIGDPETLDTATVEMLPTDQWSTLDTFGRRQLLMQVIFNQSIQLCTRGKSK